MVPRTGFVGFSPRWMLPLPPLALLLVGVTLRGATVPLGVTSEPPETLRVSGATDEPRVNPCLSVSDPLIFLLLTPVPEMLFRLFTVVPPLSEARLASYLSPNDL